ncbi:MAG: peptidase domain protein [Panacagrimonas sp.]|nr:PDZ domain-containing protein [Panacagrimonas sp.]MCC2655997.1 peptidase domain protein [Panacagrimonas sp.]
MSADPRFTVSLPDPTTHRFHVRLELPDSGTDSQTFRLPAWIRGSYLVRDLARHVVEVRAWRDGEPAAIERLDKSTFRVAAGPGALRLEYAVQAFDESVRKAFLDSRRGFFNGSSLFYCPDGLRGSRFELVIERPAGEAYRQWRVATSMSAAEIDAQGFGRYVAENYEALIDHPVELGPFRRFDFEADGVPHALVVSGRVDADFERVTADLSKICSMQRTLFGGEPALPQYLFLTNVVSAGYGGLEHRASTALICSRADFPKAGQGAAHKEYRNFLGLCSHEYFHLWNVKRITAQSFLDSDLAREAYTRDLWHYEGVTSYYDDLMVLRAGILDAPTYLDVLAEQATRLQRSPARRRQTLADASFETWIKYYQPDENSPNAATNYYVKGALAALCVDLHLRRDSKVTLDDVMRRLWERHGREGRGVPEGGLESVAAELSGLDLKPLFDQLLRSTEELPLESLLADFGVKAELRACTSAIDDGGRTLARNPLTWVGMRLRPGETTVMHVLDDSPALAAGLSPGDQLVAIDGLRLTGPQWTRRLESLIPGVAVPVHYFRGDELFSTTLVPSTAPLDTWTFALADVGGETAERRRRWIGA